MTGHEQVVVITDSTASLTPELAAQWHVRLVPLTVVVDGQAFRDNEVDLAALAGRRASTAGPPPGDFIAALKDAPAAVIVTVAGSLSSTLAAASAAAQAADIPVEIVDSGSAAGAQALVVRAAVDVASAGGDAAQVAAAARAAARDVRLAGFLETLDGLVRSGRVPGVAAAAARTVGLQFMFELRSGRIRPMRPASSRTAAIDRLIQMCLADRRPGLVADLVLLGPLGPAADGEPSAMDELRGRLEQVVGAGRLPVGRQYAGSFGTAILVHTGPRVNGLAWRWRTP